MVRRGARALAGVLLGLLAGVAVVLAIVAFRATVEEIYVHSFGELVGWLGLPALLGPALGLWAAVRSGAGAFWRGVGVLALGLLAGIGLGALAGSLLSPRPSAPWAGGLMGSGVGLLLTGGLVALRASGHFGLTGGVAGVFLLLGAGACAEPAPDEPRTAPLPEPSEVASAVFLLGDPGVARFESYPVLPRMRRDLERWSAELGGDGRVVMLTLGDVVYPSGLHPAEHDRRATDSLRIASQIEVVSGPNADGAGARGIFIAGNHDWGQEEDWKGAVRLVRLDDFLEGWTGPARGRVEVVPEPGTGGPGVIDVGDRLRLVLLDTAWWLLGSDPAEKDAVVDSVRHALATAGNRRVVMAAHHPLESGGPHGTAPDLGETLGLRTLLKKSGVLLQDLDSRPYSDLIRRLTEVFEQVGHPDLYVGGHEHSLQVFSSWETSGGRSLVVGSASKLTHVRNAPGMLFGRSEPGYGTIFVLRDGSLHYRFEAAPARFLECGGGEATARSCMREALDAYRTVWAERIEPSP